jgi:hypothetical protein
MQHANCNMMVQRKRKRLDIDKKHKKKKEKRCLLYYVVAHKKIFLVQSEDIKDICLALPCLTLPCLALPSL